MIINASITKEAIEKLTAEQAVKGKTATYVNLAIYVDDKLDKFGNNVSIQLSQTKEEREAKKPKVYLGNGKVVYVRDMPKLAKDCAPAGSAEPF